MATKRENVSPLCVGVVTESCSKNCRVLDSQVEGVSNLKQKHTQGESLCVQFKDVLYFNAFHLFQLTVVL